MTSFQIEGGQIRFNLNNLRGSVQFHTFTKFEDTIISKTSTMALEDPRLCQSDLNALSKIHECLEYVTSNSKLEPNEQISARYWLASLFHNYFSRYELYREGWGCRKAWAHLLRMRYHAMTNILQQKGGDYGKLLDGERYNFRLALRDWRDFCIDDANHFMFYKEQGLQPIENEIKQIIYGEQKSAIKPLAFFLEDPNGKRVLDRLIANWFLRDRYDLLNAIKLTWHRVINWFRESKKKRCLGIILVAIIPIIIVVSSYRGACFSDGTFSAILSPIYILFLVFSITSIFCRIIADIFLPRLLVSILVGYLPLMLTSELWKMSNKLCWWQITLPDVLALFLSFLYLRWEIENRLTRTPELRQRVPIIRALIIIGYGLISSFLMGLTILDLVGGPLIRASFDYKGMPGMCNGVLGEIYLKGLLLFFPFALLIGVIVQVFWEEKSITHPLE